MNKYYLNYLDKLEVEAVYILREVVAQFQTPILLFSGGKDSIVLAHLAKKAFLPCPIPFKFLHIDTGQNFNETIKFRDYFVDFMGVDLIVAYVQDSIDKNRVVEEQGMNASRNRLQSTTLLDVIDNNKIDCAIGGGRRDEEKSRAKERIFSHRDAFGQWNPKSQRPEVWNLFNGKIKSGEHFRVFPISNWTEVDVWNYIDREDIKVPDLYFAKDRIVYSNQGTWLSKSSFINDVDEIDFLTKKIRFRTLGDITITGGFESDAVSVKEVIKELNTFIETERGNRTDDNFSNSAMEDRKKQGYF